MDFYPKAGVNVAKHYKDSYGSIENLISLAKNGDITAQAYLGTAYSEGVENFVEKDVEKAIGWLTSAVEWMCSSFYLHKTWYIVGWERNATLPAKGVRDVSQSSRNG